MTPTISQLTSLWYETIGGLHHKDRDCHFAISRHWSYAGESKWFINHTGYLLGDHVIECVSYEEAETRLAALIVKGIREWVDCDDSTLTPARRAEILASLT